MSQSFHNLLQYTEDVFMVYEDSSTSGEKKKYFLYAREQAFTDRTSMKPTSFPNPESQRPNVPTLQKIYDL